MPTSSKKVRELKKTKNWLAKSMKKQPKKVALTDNSAQDCAIRQVLEIDPKILPKRSVFLNRQPDKTCRMARLPGILL